MMKGFFYRATNKSNILLKEKLDSCQSKLKRAEEKLKTLSQLEIECEVRINVTNATEAFLQCGKYFNGKKLWKAFDYNL